MNTVEYDDDLRSLDQLCQLWLTEKDKKEKDLIQKQILLIEERLFDK